MYSKQAKSGLQWVNLLPAKTNIYEKSQVVNFVIWEKNHKFWPIPSEKTLNIINSSCKKSGFVHKLKWHVKLVVFFIHLLSILYIIV